MLDLIQTREFRNHVEETISEAEMLYDVYLGCVAVDFDLRGRKAATAARNEYGRLRLSFNKVALVRHWDYCIESIIPHEVAHLVTVELYGDMRHSKKWRDIAMTLGDPTGFAHFPFDIPAHRKTIKFRYRRGDQICDVARRQHELAQSGSHNIRLGDIYFEREDYTGTVIMA